MDDQIPADVFATRPVASPQHSAAATVANNMQTPTGSNRLEVRCPNCHIPTDVAVDTVLTELTCNSCGSHFSLIDQSPATHMAPSLTKLGRFELIERLGVGGFGSVWKARDKELDRSVAIKIPRAVGMTPDEQDRFFREARAAAQLKHPGIVSVYEVGRDGDSIYIVSDFVRGVTLSDWLTGQLLTSREAAELCAKIADALHHAHEQGIIHRDLKLANIMIDYDGQPHLMDFGLARRESGELSVTVEGQVLGTPAYMSPEQAAGEAHTADRRSDVYSLGVILFQLLTRELPFRGNARMLLKQVIHDEPPSPRKLDANISKDLETIVLRCLQKEPSRRYSSAADLATDLRRFLRGEPIAARPIGVIERTWRWCRHRKAIATLTSCLLLSLVLGVIVAAALARSYHNERDIALRSRAAEAKLRVDAENAARSARVAAAQTLVAKGDALHLVFKGYESRTAYIEAYHQLAELDHSTVPVEMALLRSYRTYTEPINVLRGHSKEVMAVAFAPNGLNAYSASLDGTVIEWNVKTGQNTGSFVGDQSAMSSVALSADGSRLAGGTEHAVYLWNLKNSGDVKVLNTGHRTRGLAFTPDGSRLLTLSWDGNVTFWDVENGKELRKVPIAGNSWNGSGTIDLSRDGKTAVVALYDGTIRVLDTITGQERSQLDGHSDWVVTANFSADGKYILSASYDHTARLWDAASGHLLRIFNGHTEPVRGAVFTPDNRRVVTAALDGTVRIWDFETSKQVQVLAGNTAGFRGICISPDGHRLIAAGGDDNLLVWDLNAVEMPSISRKVDIARVSHDGRTLLCADGRRQLALYDVATLKVLRRYTEEEPTALKQLYFLSDRNRFLSSPPTAIRDVLTGKVLASFPDRVDPVVSWAGNLAISSDSDIWNLKQDKTTARLQKPLKDCITFRFSPDERFAISTHRDGSIAYWNLTTGQQLYSVNKAHGDGQVYNSAFSLDGKQAITCGQDLSVRLWDLETGTLLRKYIGPQSNIESLGFSTDDRFIFAGDNQKLRVWDFASGELVDVDDETSVRYSGIIKSPTEDILFKCSGDSVERWDFSRPLTYLKFAAPLQTSNLNENRDVIQRVPLHTLGEWYAFRGVYDWAADCLEEARSEGQQVSSLELARCYWQLNRFKDAAREFRHALDSNAAPADYLRLCIGAVETQSTN